MLLRNIRKKATVHPSNVGVYYCVPDNAKTGWMVLAIGDKNPQTGEWLFPEFGESQFSHAELYSEVVQHMQDLFGTDISDIGRRCLPRGRLLGPEQQFYGTGTSKHWQILHGNDTPDICRHEIISDFGLELVKPQFVFNAFEKMEPEQTQRLITRIPEMKPLLEALLA